MTKQRKPKEEAKQVMIFRHEDTKEERRLEWSLPAVGMTPFNEIRKAFGDGPEANQWIMEKAWTE